MIINYVVTALRAFKQQKQHFVLNVLGLSVGLAAAILMALFAQYELSYDQQQPDAERVYRITQDYTKLGMEVLPLFSYVKAETTLNYDQVEDIFALTMLGSNEIDVKYQGQGYKLTSVYGATPNIENFINIDTLVGDLKVALATPNSLALSKNEALRIFGNTNIIGKTLVHENSNYTVRAVFSDLPQNTHFAFKSLAYVKHNPSHSGSYVYVKFADQSGAKRYTQMLTKRYVTGELKDKTSFYLMPLLDIHLNAKSMAEFKKGGEKQNVMIFVALSFLLILVAGFNFINISVAQSTKRAKEVGIRKALGASKAQLVMQFLSESVLISLLATFLACVIIEFILPNFNALIGREITIDYRANFILMVVVTSITVGIIAGLYPAFFISSFNVKRVLDGDLQHGNTATLVRKCLLILQASIAIGLIITAVIMSRQLTHLQNLSLGYETKNRLMISKLPAELIYSKNPLSLLTKLNDIEGIQKSFVLGFDITKSTIINLQVIWPNGEKSEGRIPTSGVGYNIVEGLGLNLLAGRDFRAEFASDWDTVVLEPFKRNVSAIVTESVAKQAGFMNVSDIIGKTISNANLKYPVDMHVVGVVSDVIIGNGSDTGGMLMFLCGYPSSTRFDVMMTIDGNNVSSIQQQVVEVLSKHANLFEPKISLLADNYKAVFRDDDRTSQVMYIFTYLAIILTMLGVFGLSSFTALRRQKEVAIRKVLGASRLGIVNLLAKEFLILVVVSAVIAFPITYWIVGNWLANFNDRIDQMFWIYGLALFIVAAITWLTVASLAFKAACTRPSQILRYE